jgi:hypothetical protein
MYIALSMALLATLLHYFRIHRYAALSLEMAIACEFEVVDTQLFFNTGKGYNQEQSIKIPILCDNKYHHQIYNFVLEPDKDLRLDPLSYEGHIRIRKMRLLFFEKEIIIPLEINRLQPGYQIVSISKTLGDDKSFSIKTVQNATDPSLYIETLKYPLFIYPQIVIYLLIYFLSLAAVVFVMMAFVLTITSLELSNISRANSRTSD